jgi:hypothetical protein
MVAKTFRRVVPMLMLGASLPVMAEVNIPNTFQAGETARASEVNANFEALQAAIEELQEQTANLRALNDHIEVMDDPNVEGGTRVVFKGVNLQLHNGDETASTNGLGNLIVGFGGDRGSDPNVAYFDKIDPVCTGTTARGNVSESQCLSQGGTWSKSPKSGSHNLVIGENNAWGGEHTLIAGRENVTVFGHVAIGQNNEAYAGQGVVIGGTNNVDEGGATLLGTSDSIANTGFYSAIVGGRFNTLAIHPEGNSGGSIFGAYNASASKQGAVVLGGDNGTASGRWSSVMGGTDNSATDYGASVVGGGQGQSSGIGAIILGGYNNAASGNRSAVLGGSDQTASNPEQVLP